MTIFAPARALPGSKIYDDVKRIARTLAELECDIISDGGPGLMQTADEAIRILTTHHSRWLARSTGSE